MAKNTISVGVDSAELEHALDLAADLRRELDGIDVQSVLHLGELTEADTVVVLVGIIHGDEDLHRMNTHLRELFAPARVVVLGGEIDGISIHRNGKEE